MHARTSSRSRLAASIALGAASLLAGCDGGSGETTVRFTASATPLDPGVVKLMYAASTGPHLVVQILLFGPERDLDLDGFRFGVRIGDPDVVRFVPQATFEQSALVAGEGQSISIDVDGTSDPSLVEVEIHKAGGGAGNGFSARAVTVLRLTFDVLRPGASTLTLVGLGGEPPLAFDSAGSAIAAVRFDTADALVEGVSSGGGGY